MDEERMKAAYKTAKKLKSTATRCVRLYKLTSEHLVCASACFSARCIISTGVTPEVYMALIKDYVNAYKNTVAREKESKRKSND